MSSLVMEIEDYTLIAGQALPVSRKATYFLLMTGNDVNVEFSYRGSRIGGGKGLQGGDAVGPLSQPYDQVTLTSDTAQTVKIATSSDPVTITRLSGTVEISGTVKTKTDFAASLDNEGFFTAGVQGAGSGYAYYQLINPTGSGKNLVVFDVGATLKTAQTLYIHQTDDTEIAPFLKYARPQIMGGSVSLAKVCSGSGATAPTGMAATDEVYFVEFLGAEEPWHRKPTLPLIIPPGYGMLISAAADISASVGFLEVTA